ncbi:MAG: YHS domain-containing protein [Nitrososphaerota archaeon]|nr:YHS domain-containing protein [Nitrososphaerota archaeon]MDG6938961.1 YHS domain-containing protein [Nitrososphaerota archaeon]
MAAVDPVCKMKVEEAAAKFTSQYDGRTFFFCCAGCKAKFDGEPRRYAR